MANLNSRSGGDASRVGISAASNQVTIQSQIGTEGSDTLTGTAGDDIIDGLGGWDQIYWGDGNDVLRSGADGGSLAGEAGDDRLEAGVDGASLNGGLGNDILIGSDVNDLIWLGQGADVVDAGGGNDYFDFSSNESANLQVIDTGPGDDTIYVYSYGAATFDISAASGGRRHHDQRAHRQRRDFSRIGCSSCALALFCSHRGAHVFGFRDRSRR